MNNLHHQHTALRISEHTDDAVNEDEENQWSMMASLRNS